MSGGSYGLALEVATQPSEYLGGGLTTATGARLTVQERNAYPLVGCLYSAIGCPWSSMTLVTVSGDQVEEYGVDVSPARLTTISLQLVPRHLYSQHHIH